MKQLMQKFLRGECSEEEVRIIVDYLKESDDMDYLPELEEVRKLFPEQEFMEKDVADDIFERILQEGKKVGGENGKSRRRPWAMPRWQMIAASITLILMLSIGSYYLAKPEKVSFTTAYGQTDSVRLDDGTLVILNSNSKLTLKKAFLHGNRREVQLDGEAFFAVAPNPEKPFVVHTRHKVDIEVLGTSFNVVAREHETSVVLSEGAVRAKFKEESLLLQPGDLLRVIPQTNTMAVSQTDTLYHASWRHQLLAFKNEPLLQVAHTINDRYGYELVFADPQWGSDLRFTGSVPSDDLDLAIEMIALTFGFDVNRRGNRIELITKK